MEKGATGFLDHVSPRGFLGRRSWSSNAGCTQNASSLDFLRVPGFDLRSDRLNSAEDSWAQSVTWRIRFWTPSNAAIRKIFSESECSLRKGRQLPKCAGMVIVGRSPPQLAFILSNGACYVAGCERRWLITGARYLGPPASARGRSGCLISGCTVSALTSFASALPGRCRIQVGPMPGAATLGLKQPYGFDHGVDYVCCRVPP